MVAINLHPISEAGQAPRELHGRLSDIALQICSTTEDLYQASSFTPPWVGYLACDNGHVVGTCAFNTTLYQPGIHGKAEIAYFTFPGFEGRGYATRMAQALIDIALAANPRIAIIAHTAPEKNASNHILAKLGFCFAGPIQHPEDGTVWEWALENIA